MAVKDDDNYTEPSQDDKAGTDESPGTGSPTKPGKEDNSIPKSKTKTPCRFMRCRKRDGKERENIITKIASVLRLFRFSDGLDKFFIILGILCAIANGVAIPALIMVFSDITSYLVGTGILFNYLDSIRDYLDSIGKTDSEIMANPTLIDCDTITRFYGGNITCDQSLLMQKIMDGIVTYAMYCCMIGAGVLFTAYGQIAFWMTAAERQGHRIRKACFENILRQDIGWFDTHDAAELNTRLGEDISKIQNGIGERMGSFWKWIFCMMSCLALAIVYGSKLTITLLAPSPLLIFPTFALCKWTQCLSCREMGDYAHANSIAQEVFKAIRTVAAFGGQDKESERYKQNLSPMQKCGGKKGLARGVMTGFIFFYIYCIIGLGIWYGGKLFMEDDMYRVNTVVTVILSIIFFAFAGCKAATNCAIFSNARSASHIVFEIIDKKSTVDSYSEEGLKPESVKGTLSFVDVYLNDPLRPDLKILDGFNMQVEPGQTVALVGRDNCGKNSVAQLLMRFYQPQKGKITIDGQDLNDLNVKWLRQNIGLVSREPVLFATTVAENIRYGREDVTMEEIEKATKEAHAYDFIQKLPDKFETLVGENGAQLSGGQKQRLAIARALVRDPKILLLDEATSALDTEIESIVQDALDKAREGRTTLIIGNDPHTIKVADVIFGLDKGKVAERGSHDDLIKGKAFYSQLMIGQVDIESKGDNFQEMIQKELVQTEGTVKETAEKDQNDMIEFPPKCQFTRVMKYGKPECRFILLGCCGSFLSGSLLAASAVIFSFYLNVFTHADPEKQKKEFCMYALMSLGIGMLGFWVLCLQGYMFGRSGEALTTRLRDMCFRAIMRQDMSYFDKDKNNARALASTLAVDAPLAQGVIGCFLRGVVIVTASIVIGLIIAFVYGWKMTLIIILLLLIMFFGCFVETKLRKCHASKNIAAMDSASKISEESFHNMRTIASLTKESTFLDSYMGSLEMPHKDALKKIHLVGLISCLSQATVFFGFAAIFIFGANMIQEGSMNFKDVFLNFSVFALAAVYITNGKDVAACIGKVEASARHIINTIDLLPSIDYSNPNGMELSDNYNVELSMESVEFCHPKKKSVKVLQGLTLSVFPGQTVALVGSSGCGKRMTLQLFQRLYDAQCGQVVLDICNLKDLNIEWLREQIGIVSQEPTLFDTSIAENIAYGDNSRTVTMDEIVSAARGANIHNFIASLPNGYSSNLGPIGTQLSSSQKQRIAIARVLVRKPKILLIEEASFALDTADEKIEREALDKAREGLTCIVIAHRLSTVQTADKIFVVSHGKMSESGTHNELMEKRGSYYRLVQSSISDS